MEKILFLEFVPQRGCGLIDVALDFAGVVLARLRLVCCDRLNVWLSSMFEEVGGGQSTGDHDKGQIEASPSRAVRDMDLALDSPLVGLSRGGSSTTPFVCPECGDLAGSPSMFEEVGGGQSTGDHDKEVFGGGLEGSARVGFKVTNCTVPAVAAAIMRAHNTLAHSTPDNNSVFRSPFCFG
ncbi:hypothetical protein F2Q70_00005446 [Brassica cretica]|uniref:Uncharacterized protein n=1 Tax=Brassica cretica TaxID=69181 RepID=A0A8S9IZI5_BRACR|nr:hypothetical protein F2Q70_00005446 [Brassica cretica]